MLPGCGAPGSGPPGMPACMARTLRRLPPALPAASERDAGQRPAPAWQGSTRQPTVTMDAALGSVDGTAAPGRLPVRAGHNMIGASASLRPTPGLVESCSQLCSLPQDPARVGDRLRTLDGSWSAAGPHARGAVFASSARRVFLLQQVVNLFRAARCLKIVKDVHLRARLHLCCSDSPRRRPGDHGRSYYVACVSGGLVGARWATAGHAAAGMLRGRPCARRPLMPLPVRRLTTSAPS